MKLSRCLMTESGSCGFYMDEKLLHEEKHKNLAKNYASLKNIEVVVVDDEKKDDCCKIVNQSEVSGAFNTYLQRIKSAVKINISPSIDKKLLNLCEKIPETNSLPFKSENTENKALKDDNLNRMVSIPKINQEIVGNTDPNEINNHIVTSNPENKVTVDDFLIEQHGNKEKLKSSSSAHKNTNVVSQGNDYERGRFIYSSSDIFSNDSKEIYESHRKKLEMYKMPIIHNDGDVIKDTPNSDFGDQKSEKLALSSERPYACPKCKLSFKRNLHLKRHFTVTHTVNKNFKCEICGKMFSRKDYLDKHVGGHQKKNFKLKLLQQGIVVRTKMFSKSNK